MSLDGRLLAGQAPGGQTGTLLTQLPFTSNNLEARTAVAGEGPTLKRMHTRARGSGSSVRKRTAHIKITLIEAEPVEKPVKAKGIKKSKLAKAATKETAAPAPASEETKN